jgi:hypothetical protein
VAEGVADEFAEDEGRVVHALLADPHGAEVAAEPLPGTGHGGGGVGERDAPLDLVRAVPRVEWGVVS